MSAKFHAHRQVEYGVSPRSPSLRWLRILSLLLILGAGLSPWAISPPPAVFAQGGSGNLLQNSAFEGLSPWSKWPAGAPGIVAAESCCANHTPGGGWDAYIQPEGQEVVIFQSVSVTPSQNYQLSAWVSTNGMMAYLRWWSNATNVAEVCGQTSAVWPAYAYLSCQFTVPAGTTNFNVQLSGTAASGKWAVTDDWSLTTGGSGNLIWNADFESSITPWKKWPSTAPGVLQVNSNYNHTAGGKWSAYIQPDGQEVVIYQSVPVVPGNWYYLSAWVSTNGMTAALRWWSDATNVAEVCGQTSAVWPIYVYLSCEFFVPANTTSFNVQLSGVANPGLWAVTDDWILSHAAVTGQAFGTRSFIHVTGARANIWTAVQPNDWWGIASPNGICTTSPPCEGDFFETGYVKGVTTSPPNKLQQYAAWTDPGGNITNRFGLGNLTDNTWYNFQTLYDSGVQRWQAYRDGAIKFTAPALTFREGNMVACGGEGGGLGFPMGVECSSTEFKIGLGNWTLYNYTMPQIWGPYCVQPASSPYSSVSWGPC